MFTVVAIVGAPHQLIVEFQSSTGEMGLLEVLLTPLTAMVRIIQEAKYQALGLHITSPETLL